MWIRWMVFGGAWIGITAVALPQAGSGISGEDAILARQASLDMSSITLRSLADAMQAGGEAKSQGYPAAALAKWAKALPRLFPAGSGKGETSAMTQARPAVWQDRAGFDKAAGNYAEAAARLAALAASNDTPGFTKQLGEVQQACSSCHAKYKEGAQGPPTK